MSAGGDQATGVPAPIEGTFEFNAHKTDKSTPPSGDIDSLLLSSTVDKLADLAVDEAATLEALDASPLQPFTTDIDEDTWFQDGPPDDPFDDMTNTVESFARLPRDSDVKPDDDNNAGVVDHADLLLWCTPDGGAGAVPETAVAAAKHALPQDEAIAATMVDLDAPVLRTPLVSLTHAVSAPSVGAGGSASAATAASAAPAASAPPRKQVKVLDLHASKRKTNRTTRISRIQMARVMQTAPAPTALLSMTPLSNAVYTSSFAMTRIEALANKLHDPSLNTWQKLQAAGADGKVHIIWNDGRIWTSVGGAMRLGFEPSDEIEGPIPAFSGADKERPHFAINPVSGVGRWRCIGDTTWKGALFKIEDGLRFAMVTLQGARAIRARMLEAASAPAALAASPSARQQAAEASAAAADADDAVDETGYGSDFDDEEHATFGPSFSSSTETKHSPPSARVDTTLTGQSFEDAETVAIRCGPPPEMSLYTAAIASVGAASAGGSASGTKRKESPRRDDDNDGADKERDTKRRRLSMDGK